ncbi:PINIT domain-containing protein [Lophiotrema nucula]|uniref:PINIT domain-containing protein n=1 Tax=Lophiotrema nucula TaxID=690887 RepID=A0A6A5Z754_9PLEO|nr:PINIT domain-containing protein [Lophiotrema nucula]
MSHAANLTTAQQLIARSKTLVNNDLKRICKEEGQTVSGNKPQLQARVQSLIDGAAARNDTETLNRLRHRLHHHGEAPPADASPGYPPNFSSPNAPSSYEVNGYSNSSQQYTPYQQQNMVQRPRNTFRDSPFYKFEDLVLTNLTLEVSPSHRQTAARVLQLSNDVCARLKSDAAYRLLLFSASEDLGPFAQYDVSFPSQIEVKINGEEVKANFKGLKNKAGSTRPADITDLVRKIGGYKNALQITYALTQKASRDEKFSLYVYLVRRNSVPELINTVKSQAVFTKQQVIDEMLKKASDPDIVFDSINMSLKDPVSYSTINIPCRSNICTHNQCFDIESFLLLQEQAPTWQCPVCNKTVSFQGLAVDLYVQDILKSVPRGTEQVTIQPNGQWTQANKQDNATPKRNGYSADDDDDDSDDDIQVVEAPDYRVSAIKNEATHTPLSSIRTPPLSSREASTAPRTGSKRTSEVIDLTLSDDDEPVRPTKKVAYSTPNSLPEPSHRYQHPSYGSSSAPRTHPSAQPHPQNSSHSQHQSSTPSSLRLHFRPVSQNHSSSGTYRPPPPRPNYSYQGSGSSSYYSNSP